MPSGIYKHKSHTEKTKRKMSKSSPKFWLGKEFSEKMKTNISESHKGKPLSEMGHKPNCPCCMCTAKRGEMKGKNNPLYGMMGEKNPRWKDGGSRGYWQRKSREVWEKYHNRKIPKGYLIHHKDEDWTNIDPKNLELISRSRHPKWHAQLRRLKKRTQEFLKEFKNEITQKSNN